MQGLGYGLYCRRRNFKIEPDYHIHICHWVLSLLLSDDTGGWVSAYGVASNRNRKANNTYIVLAATLSAESWRTCGRWSGGGECFLKHVLFQCLVYLKTTISKYVCHHRSSSSSPGCSMKSTATCNIFFVGTPYHCCRCTLFEALV